jgi:hypothetical protein
MRLLKEAPADEHDVSGKIYLLGTVSNFNDGEKIFPAKSGRSPKLGVGKYFIRFDCGKVESMHVDEVIAGLNKYFQQVSGDGMVYPGRNLLLSFLCFLAFSVKYFLASERSRPTIMFPYYRKPRVVLMSQMQRLVRSFWSPTAIGHLALRTFEVWMQRGSCTGIAIYVNEENDRRKLILSGSSTILALSNHRLTLRSS